VGSEIVAASVGSERTPHDLDLSIGFRRDATNSGARWT
jgi:hypothetical protein